MPAFAAPSTDSLVGYWKFDETSGTSATDASGDGHTGTHTNGPTISTTVPSTNFTNPRSLSFDGTDDYVLVSGSSTLKPTTTITVSAWVNPASVGSWNKALIFPYGASSWTAPYFSYQLGAESSSPHVGFNVDSDYTHGGLKSSTAFTLNTWTHVTGTFNNGIIKLYVNGNLDSTKDVTSYGTQILYTSRTNPVLGTDAEYTILESWNGLIDDVRIYNRALSATEISALAAGTHPLATWDGDTSTNFETAANWDIGAIPDPYNRVTIANAGARPIATANIQTTGLTINSGAALDLSSYNLTLNDSGTFTNNGTLLLNGTQTLSNFTNSANTGTTIIKGATNLTGFPTGTTYNNLRIEDPTENGLVGYWKLDEGGGTSAVDLSGNANTGTLTNGPTYSTTVNSTTTYPDPYSLSFDGSNDYVSISDHSSFNFGSNNFAISFWINPSASGQSGIIGNTISGDSQGWTVEWSSTDTVRFFGSGGISYVAISPTVTKNVWTHITIVRNGNSITSYANTVAGTSSTVSSSIPNGGSGVAIGRFYSNTNGYNFNGLIDDVRIYNRALSQAEITNLAAGRYAAGDTGTATHTLNGNVTVNGTLSLDSGNINSSSYTDTVTGLASIYGGAYTAGTATQTFNSGLTVAGGTYTGGTGTTDVNGVLTVSAGTLTAPGSTSSLNVSGNFAHSGGTFTHNSGTVILDGNDQTISGATTFNNLTKTTSNTTLTFPASTTQTIAGTLTLQGASGLPLSLRSSTTGTQWSIDPQGTRTVSYLDLKDSNNTNATAISASTAGTFTNSGNNTNWTFNQTPVVTSPQNINIDGGKFIRTSFSASDADGDTLTYSAGAGFPNGLTVNSGTGIVTGTIPCYSNGVTEYTVTWQATDTNSATGTATSVISVACNSGGGGGSGSSTTTTTQEEPKETIKPPQIVPPPNDNKGPSKPIPPRPPKPLPPGFKPIDISTFPKPPQPPIAIPPSGVGPPVILVPTLPPAPTPTLPSVPVSAEPEPPKPLPPGFEPIDISKLPQINAEFPKIPTGITQPPSVSGNIEKVNVIFAGSPATFSLPQDSEVSKIFKNTLLSDLDVFVTITDANNKEYVVDANVLVSLVDNSVQITTDTIPLEVIEGPGTLILLINNKPEARISIFVSTGQNRSGTEIGKFQPIINSIKIKRKEDNLKLIISGANFFDTSESSTEVSILPNTGLERKDVKILKGDKVMIVTYKIIDKDINGKVNLSIVNSFGQVIKTVEIPKR